LARTFRETASANTTGMRVRKCIGERPTIVRLVINGKTHGMRAV